MPPLVSGHRIPKPLQVVRLVLDAVHEFPHSEVEYLRHRAPARDEAARRVSFVLADGSPFAAVGVVDAVGA